MSMTTSVELPTRSPVAKSGSHIRVADYLLDCLRCPKCASDLSLTQDSAADASGGVMCGECGSTYDCSDRIVNLSSTARFTDPVFQQEFDDWEHNADYYVDEPASPLYQLLHDRKMATFGISGVDRPVILDFGAGTGFFSHQLAKIGCRPVTLDFSPRMLRAGMRQYDLPAAILAAAPPLPFRSECFDAVIANGVLHHCKAQNVMHQVMQEIRRVLKPDGMLYVYDRNGAWAGRCLHHFVLWAKNVMQKRLTASSSASSHEPDFTEDDLNACLAAGFQIQRRRFVSTLPTFGSIVATNTLSYAGWPRPAALCRTLVRPLLAVAEGTVAAKWFTVEQCLCLTKVAEPPAGVHHPNRIRQSGSDHSHD